MYSLLSSVLLTINSFCSSVTNNIPSFFCLASKLDYYLWSEWLMVWVEKKRRNLYKWKGKCTLEICRIIFFFFFLFSIWVNSLTDWLTERRADKNQDNWSIKQTINRAIVTSKSDFLLPLFDTNRFSFFFSHSLACLLYSMNCLSFWLYDNDDDWQFIIFFLTAMSLGYRLFLARSSHSLFFLASIIWVVE